MKSLLTPGRIAMAIAMLGWSVTLPAQSLGPVRAKAWVGRPLDLIVPVRLEDAQARDDCVHATVSYGDRVIPAGQVSARYQVVGDMPRVHVRVEAPVDEPVLSVAVRAGCGSTVTRKYTVLTELAADEPLAARTQFAEAAPALSGAAAAAAAMSPRLSRPVAGAGTEPPARVTAREPKAVVTQPPRVRSVVHRAKPAMPEAAAPMLASADGVPQSEARPWTLRLTPLLSSQQDVSRRATAALMWRVLNADPEELLRTSVQLQQAQAELAQLRAAPGLGTAVAAAPATVTHAAPAWPTEPPVVPLTFSTAKSATSGEAPAVAAAPADAPTAVAGAGPAVASHAPAVQPARAEAAPVTDTVREVLSFVPWQSWAAALATFFVIMAAAAWGRSRPKEAQPSVLARESHLPADPWDEHESLAPEAAAIAEPLTLPPVPDAPVAPEKAAPSAEPARSVPSPELVPVLADAVKPSVRTRALRAATAPTSPPALRMEALASTLQEAQFLASVGLRKDALQVLRSYIRDSAQPAPIAFYELMVLSANSEDNRKSLPAVRRRFHEVYGVPAPSLDDLEAPAGAEAHAPLMEKIATVWPSLRVLSMIQHRVFAKPDSMEQPLSIHAWRDLMWLHDMAREVLATMGISADGDSAADESLAPWVDADAAALDQPPPELHDHVTDPDRFALDLDLAADPPRYELREGQPSLHRPAAGAQPEPEPEPPRPQEPVVESITAAPMLELAPLEWDQVDRRA